MANVNDVMDAMIAQISQALVNAGVMNQGYIAPGWPNMPDLTKQMEQVPAQYYVSVWPMPTQRLTTRFFPITYNVATVTPELVAAVSGGTISLSGTPTAGTNVTAILSGKYMTTYQPVVTDTLNTVAGGLATAINNLGAPGITAVATTSSVSVTGATSLFCNVGGTTSTAFEALRTEQHFQISCWCPDPLTREAISEAIKTWFATVYFLQFPDTSYGRMKFVMMPWNDSMQLDTLYSAKLIYSVDWATLSGGTATQITATKQTTITQTSVTDVQA